MSMKVMKPIKISSSKGSFKTPKMPKIKAIKVGKVKGR